MFKVKNTESKKTVAKRNITISGVKIDGGKFYDESGDITANLISALPDPEMEFTIKISIELDDEEETEEEG